MIGGIKVELNDPVSTSDVSSDAIVDKAANAKLWSKKDNTLKEKAGINDVTIGSDDSR